MLIVFLGQCDDKIAVNQNMTAAGGITEPKSTGSKVLSPYVSNSDPSLVKEYTLNTTPSEYSITSTTPPAEYNMPKAVSRLVERAREHDIVCAESPTQSLSLDLHRLSCNTVNSVRSVTAKDSVKRSYVCDQHSSEEELSVITSASTSLLTEKRKLSTPLWTEEECADSSDDEICDLLAYPLTPVTFGCSPPKGVYKRSRIIDPQLFFSAARTPLMVLPTDFMAHSTKSSRNKLYPCRTSLTSAR